jgi:energy-converting hydrogenase Eha subunit A
MYFFRNLDIQSWTVTQIIVSGVVTGVLTGIIVSLGLIVGLPDTDPEFAVYEQEQEQEDKL